MTSTSAGLPANDRQQNDRQQLENIQQQLVKAWVTRERSILEQVLAPDWKVTHTDGRMSSREEILCDFDTGANRLLEGHVDDLNVRSFDTFAIVTGRTHARGEYRGHGYDVTLHFTDVFVRCLQGWQAVASHASRIVGEDKPEEKTGTQK